MARILHGQLAVCPSAPAACALLYDAVLSIAGLCLSRHAKYLHVKDAHVCVADRGGPDMRGAAKTHVKDLY